MDIARCGITKELLSGECDEQVFWTIQIQQMALK